MTTPTQSDKQRVREVHAEPDAESSVAEPARKWFTCPSCERSCHAVSINGVWRCSLCFPDAASRLPKATTDHEFVWRADSEQCSVCGENHHGCIIVKQPSVSPVDEGEAAPQTFEEWHSRTPVHSADPCDVEWARYHRQLGWNAAKASSPAVAGGESETVEENLMLKKFINDIYGGAAQGLLAYSRFRRKQQTRIKDVRGKE